MSGRATRFQRDLGPVTQLVRGSSRVHQLSGEEPRGQLDVIEARELAARAAHRLTDGHHAAHALGSRISATGSA
jgi:hypothetical protein